jgi:hypothetical protein
MSGLTETHRLVIRHSETQISAVIRLNGTVVFKPSGIPPYSVTEIYQDGEYIGFLPYGVTITEEENE